MVMREVVLTSWHWFLFVNSVMSFISFNVTDNERIKRVISDQMNIWYFSFYSENDLWIKLQYTTLLRFLTDRGNRQLNLKNGEIVSFTYGNRGMIHHGSENITILVTFSPMSLLEVVTSMAASDGNVVKMTFRLSHSYILTVRTYPSFHFQIPQKTAINFR